MNRAVFLDRDGTVIDEVGYLCDLKQVRLIPGAAAAIKRLNEAGLKVVLVTNQSGIARGYFTEAFVRETHDLLGKMLRIEGARLDGIYYCPHHPKAGQSSYTTACDCRKPGTGMLEQAARELDIDIKGSFVVGDKWSDVELGQRAGAHSILVGTGYSHDDPGNARLERLNDPDFIAETLTDAADWIVRQTAKDEQ
jgi:D-glycero-D-manno-heptose 1,7-bisphosphate phosphatase